MYSIKNPEFLHIMDGEELCFGANQEWYRKYWQRLAGCGPTSATHLVHYLSAANGLSIFESRPRNKCDFLLEMEELWDYVTPTYRGVNSTVIFTGGVRRLSKDKGIDIGINVLEIAMKKEERIEKSVMDDFIVESLEADRPVAFLNLNNGEVENLDRWHWVTIVGYNPVTAEAEIYDQCKKYSIDLGLWHRTTILSGGFVSLFKK